MWYSLIYQNIGVFILPKKTLNSSELYQLILKLCEEFWRELLRIDAWIWHEHLKNGHCRVCKSKRLRRHRYCRKPRGLPESMSKEIIEALQWRNSSRCKDCGAQNTPASVVFLGRKVYVGVMVILATRLLLDAKHPIQKYSLFGEQASLLTVMRWQYWWHYAVAKNAFWKQNQGRLQISTKIAHLITKAWNHFQQQCVALTNTAQAILIFFSPITIPQQYPTHPRLSVGQLKQRGWDDEFF